MSLDAILDQMRDLKVDHWSQLGRFRRSNIKFLNGRLLCDSDLASEGARVSFILSTFNKIPQINVFLEHDIVDDMVPYRNVQDPFEQRT